MKKRLLVLLLCVSVALGAPPCDPSPAGGAQASAGVSTEEINQIETVVNLLSASRWDFDLLHGTANPEAMHRSILSALLLSRRYEQHYQIVGEYDNSYSADDYREVVTGVFGQRANAFPSLLIDGAFRFSSSGYIDDNVRIDAVSVDSEGFYQAYGVVTSEYVEDGPRPVERPYYHATLEKNGAALFGFVILLQERSAFPFSSGGGGSSGGSGGAYTPPTSPYELTFSLIASSTRGKSTLDGTSTYYVKYLLDNKDDTSWQTKNAVGAYLEATFSLPVKVSQLYVKNGYWKKRDRYYRNNRVREVEVSYRYQGAAEDDFSGAEYFTLEDPGINKEWQILPLSPGGVVEAVRMTILSIYPAQEYSGYPPFPEDTALNEFRLYGEPYKGR